MNSERRTQWTVVTRNASVTDEPPDPPTAEDNGNPFMEWCLRGKGESAQTNETGKVFGAIRACVDQGAGLFAEGQRENGGLRIALIPRVKSQSEKTVIINFQVRVYWENEADCPEDRSERVIPPAMDPNADPKQETCAEIGRELMAALPEYGPLIRAELIEAHVRGNA